MTTGRALTTEYERECLRGEHGNQRKYEAKSRVKKRINEALTQDIELFDEHAQDLNDELQEAVCGPPDVSDPSSENEKTRQEGEA